MGLLQPHVGHCGCHGQAALSEDDDPAPEAQARALWAVGIIAILTVSAIALVPGASDGVVNSLKFITGYSEVERAVSEITE